MSKKVMSLLLTVCVLGTSGPRLSGCVSPDVRAAQQGLVDPTWSGFPWDSIVPSQAFGELEDSLTVTPQGEAAYTIPLAVPPGRAGMEPNLSLSYQSGNGDGVFGVGFNLTGVPARIRQCPVSDRDNSMIDWTAGSFCLGGDRLVRVATVATNAEYRTRAETYARIQTVGAVASPTSFTITERSGNTVLYGQQVSTTRWRHDSSGQAASISEGPVVIEWLPTLITDRFGNQMSFTWTVQTFTVPEGSAVDVRLSSIQYPQNRSVSFAYESRPAPNPISTTWSSGVGRTSRTRAVAIHMTSPDVPGAEAYHQWSYYFNYTSNSITGRPRIGQVTRCDLNGLCLPATNLNWENGSMGVTTQVVNPPVGYETPTQLENAQVADFDGDGRQDIAARGSSLFVGWFWYRSTPTGLVAFETTPGSGTPGGGSSLPQTPFFVDLNGDGRTEHLTQSSTTLTWYVSVPSPTGTIDSYPFHVGGQHAYAADYDGDGAVDLYFENDESSGVLYRGHGSNLPSTFDPPVAVNCGESVMAGTPPPVDNVDRRVTDVDGDGRAEIFYLGSQYSKTCRPALVPEVVDRTLYRGNGTGLNDEPGVLIDLNGDGLQDWLSLSYGWYRTNLGRGWGPHISAGFPGINESRDHLRVWITDWNLDGFSDVFYRVDAPYSTYTYGLLLSNGQGGLTATALPFTGEVTQVMDYDGDGIDDVLDDGPAYGAGAGTFTFRRHATARPDRLISIQRGNGSFDRIEYGTVASASLDAPGSASFPTASSSRRMPVVARIVVDNGTVGAFGLFEYNTIEYRYGNPLNDAHSRAFLGFSRIRRTNLRTGVVSETAYHPISGVVRVPENTGTGIFMRNRYPDLGGPTDRVTTDQGDDGRLIVTRTQYLRDEGAGSITGTWVKRPTGTHRWSFEVNATQWNACVVASFNRMDIAAQKLLDGLGCTGTAVARISQSSTIYSNYDAYSHPRTVTTQEMQPGTSAVLRRRTVESFYQDYTGGTAYINAVNRSTRVANGMVDLPDFVRTTEEMYVGTDWTSRPLVQRYLWGSAGQLVAQVREPGVNPAVTAIGTPAADPDATRLTTVILYDIYGNPAQVHRFGSSGSMRSTTLGYDEDFTLLRSMRNPAGHLSYIGMHPAFGVPVVSVDPNGAVDTYQYDGFGRLRSERIRGGAGRTLSYGYRSITENRYGGGSTTVTFDELGRQRSTTSTGLGTTVSSSIEYQTSGIVKYVTRPTTTGVTATEVRPSFDQRERLTSVTVYPATGAALTTLSRRYISPGALELATGEVVGVEDTAVDGDQRRMFQDPLGATVRSSEMNPVGFQIEVNFDEGPLGQLARATDAEGNAMTTVTDAVGRVKQITAPDRGTQTITYNAFDEYVQVVRPGVGTTVYARDMLGRVTSETTGAEVNTFVYDIGGAGQLSYTTSPGGRTDYTYDSLGRLWLTDTYRAGAVYYVDFSYDSFSRLSSVSYPVPATGTRLVVQYQYDPTSGICNRVFTAGGEVEWNLIEHDGEMRPRAERYGNNRVEHVYHPVHGTVTNLTVRKGLLVTSPVVHQLTATPHNDGNVNTRGDTVMGRNETFLYDRHDRISQWLTDVGAGATRVRRRVTYTYSNGGRITNVLNEESVGTGAYTTVADETYRYQGVRGAGPGAASAIEVLRPSGTTTTLNSYDVAGRQTNAGARTVAYNFFDLPSTITDGVTRTYDYDANHARARVRQGSTEDTIYVGNWFERRIRSGFTTENVMMVYGPNGRIGQVRQNDGTTTRTTDYTHSDHLGSATVTTNAAGDVTARQWFGPFGVRLASTGRDVARGVGVPANLRTGFGGHEQEDALGLVDMGGRFYDPYQRRFMTPDPFVVDATSTQSWNAYTYVRNNPLNRIDPTGFEDYSDCHCPDYPDGHPDQPDTDTYVAGDPGGYGHDDLGYDPGGEFDAFMAGTEQFDGMGSQDMGLDFSSGSNDGGAGVGKQDSNWQLPQGFQIDGPESAFFTSLFRSAMEHSPSFAARVREHSASGRATVRLHAPSGNDPLRAFGSADMLNRSARGAAGEHTLDARDFELLLLPVATSGEGTSQEQFLVHEVVEAIGETRSTQATDPHQASATWYASHIEGLNAENEFRSDVGRPGVLLARDAMEDRSVWEVYVGASHGHYSASDLAPPWRSQ